MPQGDRAAGHAAGLARRGGGVAGRVIHAFRTLPSERRLAAGASLGLFVTLFLPWYQETVIATDKTTRLLSASDSVTGWGAFSFVEAAVLLVAVGVLTLLFQRAEGRAFHLPGGDGWVIMLAGGWTCCLVVWRIFDKQGTSSKGQLATTWGIEWGIFVALVIAGLLAYAGRQIRRAHTPEPPLPGEPERNGGGGGGSGGVTPAARAQRAPRPPRAQRVTPVAQAPHAAGEPPERPVGWLTARPGDDSGGAPATPRTADTPAGWSYGEEVSQHGTHGIEDEIRRIEEGNADQTETLPAPRRRRRLPPEDR
ncbi:MAG TPA: hypothetical protein VG223_10325 [Solirubrobacteraceae bacterium]|nr:hypothetical protein [Solirubrobacteraceae bacterium]